MEGISEEDKTNASMTGVITFVLFLLNAKLNKLLRSFQPDRQDTDLEQSLSEVEMNFENLQRGKSYISS